MKVVVKRQNTQASSSLFHSSTYYGQEFDDGLRHWKYIKREKVGGKWRYWYDDQSASRDIKAKEDALNMFNPNTIMKNVADANSEIQEGRKKVEESNAKYNKKYEDANLEIQEGRKKVEESNAKYNKKYEDTKSEMQKQEKEIRQELDTEHGKEFEDLYKKLMDNPDVAKRQQETSERIESGRKSQESMRKEHEEAESYANQKEKEVRDSIEENRKQVEEAKSYANQKEKEVRDSIEEDRKQVEYVASKVLGYAEKSGIFKCKISNLSAKFTKKIAAGEKWIYNNILNTKFGNVTANVIGTATEKVSSFFNKLFKKK